ncbi:hypothetical protein [Dinghuibacter silviterrae]|uniref:HTH cro/C1-type domain-containing protein n=1 Tax=Dinghuibacter silviterrae TaxID=1539049 RepID=A0A4R8DFS2_9BACT|nr:hypothetical protein [Dinghuibacter silviterrae]TDW96188.1 hypothetical protein EDB95_4012 [Dinghuibacter silviterrae]
MKKVSLIIEKTDDGFLGRVSYKDDLIIEEAETLAKLDVGIKKILRDFYELELGSVYFEHKYDLSALFEKFDYLKISNVAKIAGMNASLLRQYVTGKKHASKSQAKKIEEAIHCIGKELSDIKVYSK